jgi:NAD-specific glutamate dehydrogenase
MSEDATPGRSSEQAEAAYVQACDAAGVLGRLALRVVEVCGHRDDCLGDLRPSYQHQQRSAYTTAGKTMFTLCKMSYL